MGLFNKDIGTLDDLFVHQLRDIYYAEKQIVQTLPEMIEKATDLHDLLFGVVFEPQARFRDPSR